MATELSVLIVEDNESDAKLNVDALVKSGYAVHFQRVESAGEMKEALFARHWDIILTDYYIPGFGAPAALNLLQETGLDIPFIVISRAIGEDKAVELMKAGANDYILKDKMTRLPSAIYREIREAKIRAESRKSENDLKESEESFRRIFEESPLGMALVNEKERFIMVNAAFCDLVRYSADELKTLTFHDITHPDHIQDDMMNVEKIRRSEINVYKTVRKYIRKDKAIVWGSVTITRIPDVSGNFLHFLVVVEDFTERIKAQKELEENEMRYRKLFDLSPSGIILEDSSGTIIDVNIAVCRLTGYSKNELVGKHVSILAPGEKKKEVDRHIAEILSGKTLEMDYINVKKDGSLLDIELRESSIILPDGHVGILSVSYDITARKVAEASLRQSMEQLGAFARHLQAIREEERANISRELRKNLGQNLTSIRLDIDRILKKLHTGNEDDKMLPVIDQARDMIAVIDSTLQSVQKITGDLHPRILDELGLVAAIEWQSEEFHNRSGIACSFQSNLRNISIEPVHSIGIYRILQESLTNIIRHSRASQVQIRIRNQAKQIQFEIRDNGRGITQAEIQNTRSLGILGMKERAALFGGTLIINGIEGKGTRIILKIPKKG